MASAGFLAVTGRNDAPTCVLAHIVTPSSVSYYLSSAPYVSGDAAEGETAPTNIAYTPIISGFPRVRIGIDDFLSGQASVSWGELVLATDENVAAMFGTPGASITLFVAVAPEYRGLSTATAKFPSSEWRECILIGKVSSFKTNQNRTVSITIQSATRAMFDKVVASNLFDATNTPTIPTSNIGRRKPVQIGNCANVTPVLIDAANLTYFAGDNSGTTTFYIYDVADGGLPLLETGLVAVTNADTTKIHLGGSASSVTDYYIGCAVYINNLQKVTITAYVGATKVATVSPAFNSAPATAAPYTIELWKLSGNNKFSLLKNYVYNITVGVGVLRNYVSGHTSTPIEQVWWGILGKPYATDTISDLSLQDPFSMGIVVADGATAGEVISSFARSSGCVWSMIPKTVGGVYTDYLVVRKLAIPSSAAVATFDESSIISYDLMLDTEAVWRVTAKHDISWTPTELNAANVSLAATEREKLQNGYRVTVGSNAASTWYGAKEIEINTLVTGANSIGSVITDLLNFFTGAVRKRLRITVPAFFPSPILMDKITVNLPANISTYSGDYALTGWTTYTDSNGTVLMDLELFG